MLVSLTSGQGTDDSLDLLKAIKELIKVEVSKSVKIEGQAIKNDVLKEIRGDNNKLKQVEEDLDKSTQGINEIHIFALALSLISQFHHCLVYKSWCFFNN